MTTNDQEQAKGETWRKVIEPIPQRPYAHIWIVVGSFYAAEVKNEAIADQIVADHNAAQALSDARTEYASLGDKYGRLVEQVARLVPVFAEGQQLTNTQLIDRAIKAATALSDARAALARIDAYDGPIGSTVAEIVDIARAALARLDALNGAGE